jgi:hypothetical protein
MTQSRIKIGDVFSVKIGDHEKKYFQYIANDLTQLNSQVIRAFQGIYHGVDAPELKEIIKGEVEFYAHCFFKIGFKLRYWEKVGNVQEVGETEVIFRDSNDYGNPKIKISRNWYVWKINEPFVKVGELEGRNKNAEIGVVIPPDSIVHRMRTGKYDFVYPGY